ncbi:MAG: RluA family pseudouridine synthase [Bacteroidetes bacterium]|nr:MAG: RluA family pseudouridine synthase [Bacteroidota bacterium]
MEILFEDNHLIAVNKPFGMPSQGDNTGDQPVVDWVEQYIRETYQKPGNVYTALLHRLDRPTGGVLLLAKTSKAAARVSSAFQQRKVQKTYLALALSTPRHPAGSLRHFLDRVDGRNIMRAHGQERPGRQEARLSYEVVATAGERALIQVRPETGRRHQIRVQLARIGCPLSGDLKYGAPSPHADRSIGLFAWKLELMHPVRKEPLLITAPYPEGAPWSDFSLPL